jgi:hypothetical protein
MAFQGASNITDIIKLLLFSKGNDVLIILYTSFIVNFVYNICFYYAVYSNVSPDHIFVSPSLYEKGSFSNDIVGSTQWYTTQGQSSFDTNNEFVCKIISLLFIKTSLHIAFLFLHPHLFSLLKI